MTAEEKYTAWVRCPIMTAELLSLLHSMDPDTRHDAFYRDLSFGTGGLRGVLGPGTNRMNVFTVMKATRGLGSCLLQGFKNPSCAIRPCIPRPCSVMRFAIFPLQQAL